MNNIMSLPSRTRRYLKMGAGTITVLNDENKK